MTWLIITIVAIITVFIICFWATDGVIDIVKFIFDSILLAILINIIFAFVILPASIQSNQIIQVRAKTSIYKLSDYIGIEGNANGFIYVNGSISDTYNIRYVTKKGNSYKINSLKVDYDDVTFVEDDETYIEEIQNMRTYKTNWLSEFLYSDEFNNLISNPDKVGTPTYEIHIPKGTIVEDYDIDLK